MVAVATRPSLMAHAHSITLAALAVSRTFAEGGCAVHADPATRAVALAQPAVPVAAAVARADLGRTVSAGEWMLTFADTAVAVSMPRTLLWANASAAIETVVSLRTHTRATGTNTAATASVGTFSIAATVASPPKCTVALSIVFAIPVSAANALVGNLSATAALQGTVRAHPLVGTVARLGLGVADAVAGAVVRADIHLASPPRLALAAETGPVGANAPSAAVEGTCRQLAGRPDPAIVADTQRAGAVTVLTTVLITRLLRTIVSGIAHVTRA